MYLPYMNKVKHCPMQKNKENIYMFLRANTDQESERERE